MFLFAIRLRLVMGPTQPPIQWVQGALSLAVKRPGCEADHSPPSTAEVKECVELYRRSPYIPSWSGAHLGMGPTQPPLQWVQRVLTAGVKRPGRAASHSPPSSAEVKNLWSYTSTPPYAFTAWCLFKHRNKFTFALPLPLGWTPPHIKLLNDITK